MTQEPQPYSRYITMIDEILEDKRLTPLQKILWSLIDTLSKKGDVCTASNAYLADRIGTSQGNLANELSKLRSLGFLLDELQEDGKRGLITVYEGDRRLHKRMTSRVQSQLKPHSATTEPTISPSLSQEGSPNKIENKVENKERTSTLMVELRKVVNRIFKRKDTAPWSNAEEHYLYEVCKRPDVMSEAEEIKALYASPGGHYLSNSAFRLLEQWTENLDKARNPKTSRNHEPPNRNSGTFNDGDGEKYRKLLAK